MYLLEFNNVSKENADYLFKMIFSKFNGSEVAVNKGYFDTTQNIGMKTYMETDGIVQMLSHNSFSRFSFTVIEKEERLLNFSVEELKKR
ncbi:MAG: hypothetical protein JXR69_03305 [Candidatus Delongbacteria bacterium]|nr:hypothetical protein [Candidatus Delongbacteria bacterium]